MKKRIFGGTLVVMLVAVVSVFGVIFSHTPKNNIPTEAAIPGFTYLPGLGGFDGRHLIGEGGGLRTEFNLRVFENCRVGSGDFEPAAPVFSRNDMARIARNASVDHGFVMISNTYTDMVFLEFLNPRDNGIVNSTSLSGTRMTFNRGFDGHGGFTQWGQGISIVNNMNNDDLFAHAQINANKLWQSSSTGSVIGAFYSEGYYEFVIEGFAPGMTVGDNRPDWLSLSMRFSFYIVHE